MLSVIPPSPDTLYFLIIICSLMNVSGWRAELTPDVLDTLCSQDEGFCYLTLAVQDTPCDPLHSTDTLDLVIISISD